MATVAWGVGSVTMSSGGSGYMLPGLRKFVDTLPGLTPAGANNLGQYIPVGVPDTTTYPESDYYEIAVVQYREQMHSDLPATGSLLRGYVQVSTDVVPGAKVPLCNAAKDPAGPCTPAVDAKGNQVYGVDKPHYLGPTIQATKDRPVRVKFCNLLPTGVAGDLFLPVDTTVMGSGQGPDLTPTETNNWGMGTDPQNPECGKTPKPKTCYTENRVVRAPARRGHPVDQRRHAASVDHSRGRERDLPRGRQRQERARHARSGRRLGDLLLHQPAVRAADVLPRSCVGHHPPERVRRPGRRVHHHR